jgi:site-specific recombinase XerD
VVNVHLINLLNKVNKYFLQLDSGEDKISISQFINELKGKSLSQKGLVEAYKQHIQNIEAKLNIDYSRTTIKRYKSSLKGLIEFLQNRYYKTEIKLSELKYEFIVDYENHLKNIRRLMHNSAAKEIKNLLRVIKVSILNGWLKTNPFKGFSCNYRDNYRECLTQEEVDLIYNLELTSKRIARVRDVFIFQIYTGFAYSDLAKLSIDDVQTGIDGGKWIIIKRQKTKVRSSIPLLPRALEMVNKYQNDPNCIINKKLLPVPSNQKMNDYLKDIADICKINKNLTTHLARHTFATTITLTNGVPIETVSKMLGHKSLRTTQIYSKVVDTKIAQDMKVLRERIEPAITNKTDRAMNE